MATIDEKQQATAGWLVRELLNAQPGRDALWNLTGAVGSGKTSVLRLVQDELWSHGLVPLAVTAPPGEVDAAPIALLETAGQLKTAQFLNGESAAVSDPTRPWPEKMAAITAAVDQHERTLVILCDEPTRWYHHQYSLLDDTPDSCGRSFAEWMARGASCRRIISGRIPSDVTPRARTKSPRLDDGRAFLTEYQQWGNAASLVDSLHQSLAHSAPFRSLGEMKLCVALARFKNVKQAAEQAMADTSVVGLLEELLDLLEKGTTTSPFLAALARLAVPRTAVEPGVFDELTRELEPLDRDLIRSCLCEADADRLALHPLVRQEVVNRARDPQRRERNNLWKLPVAERKALHQRLRDEYQPKEEATYRDQLESLHHELLGGPATLRGQDERLRFVEQLHEIGRTISYVYHEYGRAAELFRLALDYDPNHSYSHHYLAFNLDWLAEHSGEVETHYLKAIELRPTHPWWWSRWISYLATRGRFRAARAALRDALDAMSISEDGSPEWLYSSLHRWVARWLLHWAELDFAEEVLRSIPSEIAERDTSIQALRNLLDALRVAERGPAVFPLNIPADKWWSPNGHTELPLTWHDRPLRSWKPARVESVDQNSGRLSLVTADRPATNPTALTYREIELSRVEVEAAAHQFTWPELEEGRFLELAYYGDDNGLRIGLHRDTEFRDPHLLPLVPPPDRWYRHAVNAAWESMGNATDGSAHCS